MTILVTNDDGYSLGMEVLLNAAKTLDKNSYAIIPDRQRSAVSKAMTLHKPIRIHKIHQNVFSASGTPSDCVNFGLFCKDFKKPNLVLSGINWGDNTTLHTFYSSGTIAACVEAALFEIPAISFSIHREKGRWISREKYWGNKDVLQKRIIEITRKLKPLFKKDIFFNVNFPEEFENAKIKIVDSQRHRFKIEIEKRTDPDGRPYYWVTGPAAKKEKGKDYYSVYNGSIIITPLKLDPIAKEEFIRLKKTFK